MKQLIVQVVVLFLIIFGVLFGGFYTLLCQAAKADCEFMDKYYDVETQVDGMDCMVKGAGDTHWYSYLNYQLTHD